MARYEHLPIDRSAFDWAVHLEKIVRNFSRYHKYSLGLELRQSSRAVLTRVIKANDSTERTSVLRERRHEQEHLKLCTRLCHESGGFASTRSYLHVAEWIVNLARQNEGWLRQTQAKQNKVPSRRGGRNQETGETGHGPNLQV